MQQYHQSHMKMHKMQYRLNSKTLIKLYIGTITTNLSLTIYLKDRMLIIHNLEIQTSLSYCQTIISKQAKTQLETINHNMEREAITLENNK